MYKVSLVGATFHACHGCFDLEQRVGNHFEVDVELDVECAAAAEKDDLESTVNYARLYEVVKEQMAQPSKIIENVAHRIAAAICAEWGEKIKTVTVRVSKIAPPVGGKVARATVEYTQQLCR